MRRLPSTSATDASNWHRSARSAAVDAADLAVSSMSLVCWSSVSLSPSLDRSAWRRKMLQWHGEDDVVAGGWVGRGGAWFLTDGGGERGTRRGSEYWCFIVSDRCIPGCGEFLKPLPNNSPDLFIDLVGEGLVNFRANKYFVCISYNCKNQSLSELQSRTVYSDKTYTTAVIKLNRKHRWEADK